MSFIIIGFMLTSYILGNQIVIIMPTSGKVYLKIKQEVKFEISLTELTKSKQFSSWAHLGYNFLTLDGSLKGVVATRGVIIVDIHKNSKDDSYYFSAHEHSDFDFSDKTPYNKYFPDVSKQKVVSQQFLKSYYKKAGKHSGITAPSEDPSITIPMENIDLSDISGTIIKEYLKSDTLRPIIHATMENIRLSDEIKKKEDEIKRKMIDYKADNDDIEERQKIMIVKATIPVLKGIAEKANAHMKEMQNKNDANHGKLETLRLTLLKLTINENILIANLKERTKDIPAATRIAKLEGTIGVKDSWLKLLPAIVGSVCAVIILLYWVVTRQSS